MRISDALGGGNFILENKPFNIQLKDYNYLEVPKDYDLMMKDYYQLLWTKVIPRSFLN